MSPRLTEQYADRIAQKLYYAQLSGEGPAVGLAIGIILAALYYTLSLLIQCWVATNKEVSQADLHARLVEECADPDRKDKLIRRAARQIQRRSKTTSEPLTKEQSMILAAASIEEALIAPPAEFQNYAVACGAPSAEDVQAFQEGDDE